MGIPAPLLFEDMSLKISIFYDFPLDQILVVQKRDLGGKYAGPGNTSNRSSKETFRR